MVEDQRSKHYKGYSSFTLSSHLSLFISSLVESQTQKGFGLDGREVRESTFRSIPWGKCSRSLRENCKHKESWETRAVIQKLNTLHSGLRHNPLQRVSAGCGVMTQTALYVMFPLRAWSPSWDLNQQPPETGKKLIPYCLISLVI